VDIWTRGDVTGPSADAVAAVETLGGRVVHRFAVNKMRVVIDPHLAAAQSGTSSDTVGYSIETVTDRCDFAVGVIVMLDHHPTSTDTAMAQPLGATETSVWSVVTGYAATIDDAAIPALRALPGVTLVEGDGFFCGY
jgi:hypothetical protein